MLDRFFYRSLDAAKQGNVFWLNAVFKRILPFNAPHGIRVLALAMKKFGWRCPTAEPTATTSKEPMRVPSPQRVSFAQGWRCSPNLT